MDISFRLDKFEGPLGLLLELIEARTLEISEISLAQVTDQYLAFLEEAQDIPPESLADFLVVASALLLIKSRSLLPSIQLSPEEEAEIQDLESSLKEYQRYRRASRHIKTLVEEGRHLYTRELWQNPQNIFREASGSFGFFPPRNISCAVLAKTLSQTVEALARYLQPFDKGVVKRVISIETKIKEILKRIEKKATATFRELAGSGGKLDLILVFLAILFLFREKLVHISQDDTFGEIVVKIPKNKTYKKKFK
jgi:segregation and condensation protein A